jgi:prepilin-type N-terminal cleavage/methylation domain-containing protein
MFFAARFIMAPLAHPHSSIPESARADGLLSCCKRPSAVWASNRGMSLIELLVVAAIISMMAGLLALGLKGMKSPAIQGAASQVTSGLSLARQLAISKNTKAALFIANDTANGRIPYRHWSVGYLTNKLTGEWTLKNGKKWDSLPEGTFFMESVTNAITKPPISKSLGQTFTPTASDFVNSTNITIDAKTFTSLPCIVFSSDGTASITGNAAAIAVRIASGAVDTNGEVTLTSTNQYYFVETDGIVGRIRMRAPESYK